jgi:hypothetical protein
MVKSKQSVKSSTLKSETLLSEYIAHGSGDPTIVFESGLGDGLKIWRGLTSESKSVMKTLPPIAREFTAFYAELKNEKRAIPQPF